MTPERQRTFEMLTASQDSMPSTRAPALSERDLTAVDQPRRRLGSPPEMAVPVSGQYTLNTAATRALSPKTPLKAIRFYLAEKGKERFLVVRPAAKDAERSKSSRSASSTGITGRRPSRAVRPTRCER